MATPDYLTSLIGTESGGNWAAQNDVMGAGGMAGHFGRVQFGRARLQDAMNAGAIPQGTTPEQFMASPELQMAAEKWHFADLESKLAPYVGTVVNGKPLDMAALVAMGHLGGAGGAIKYATTGGAYNPSDAYGTSLSDYASIHGGGGSPLVASSKGGAPMGGLLDVPQQDPSGLVGLLTGQQKPWAGKLNDIGAVLLALSGSPAAQPLLEQINKRKEGAREDARLNRTAQWLASQGRDDLATAMMSGALSASDAAKIAMTPAPTPAPVELKTFTGPDGKVYSFDPTTGATTALTGAEAPKPGYRLMTPEEVAANPKLDPNEAYQISPEGKVEVVGGGGQTINVDTVGGPEMGKLSTDYGYVLGPDGKPKIDPTTGLPMAAPVPGSPAALAAEEAAKKAESGAGKETKTADIVLGKLDELDKLVDESGLLSPATGFGAETAAQIGGTRAADTKATIDTIAANMAFDALAEMRAASPTGGALGSITENELALLSSTLSSLNQKQSPEQFKRNVAQLREIYKTIKEKADAYPNAEQFGFGGSKAGGSTGDLGLSDEDMQYLGAP